MAKREFVKNIKLTKENKFYPINDFVGSNTTTRTHGISNPNRDGYVKNGNESNNSPNIQQRITRSMTYNSQLRSRRSLNGNRKHVTQLPAASRKRQANSATLEYLAEIDFVASLNSHIPEGDIGSQTMNKNNSPQIIINFCNKDDFESLNCDICLEKNVQYGILEPCKHKNICGDCIKKLSNWNCPFCRTKITSYTINKIF